MPEKTTGEPNRKHLPMILLVCIFFAVLIIPVFADDGTGTEVPTEVPTEAPTEAPALVPMEVPTEIPTEMPTVTVPGEMTQTPTEEPALTPDEEPTVLSTPGPSLVPTGEPTVEITPETTETPASTGGGFNQAAFDLAVASNPDPPLNNTKVGGSYVDPMYVPTPGYWNITVPDTYYFDKDYTGGNKLSGLWGVWIQASGVILNGNGNTLEGSQSGTGVIVSDPNGGQLHDVGIYNLALEKWDVGIQMLNVLNGIIDHVTVDNGDNYGIIVKDSKDIQINNTVISDLHGSSGGGGSNDEQFAGIWIDNSQNVLVNNSFISDISGTSSEPIKGISVTYSNNTQLIYNKIQHLAGTGQSAPGTGIYNFKSNFSTIYCNNISDISGAGNDFTYGIRMVDSRNGTVIRNHIDEIKGNNGVGMSFESVTNTSVANNRVNRSSFTNLYLKDASYNNFTQNWFVQKNTGASDTALNARMDGTNTNNTWMANYWQIATNNKYGFSETCTDANNDGYCDDPYTVDQDADPDPENVEHYALKNASLLDTNCPGCPEPYESVKECINGFYWIIFTVNGIEKSRINTSEPCGSGIFECHPECINDFYWTICTLNGQEVSRTNTTQPCGEQICADECINGFYWNICKLNGQEVSRTNTTQPCGGEVICNDECVNGFYWNICKINGQEVSRTNTTRPCGDQICADECINGFYWNICKINGQEVSRTNTTRPCGEQVCADECINGFYWNICKINGQEVSRTNTTIACGSVEECVEECQSDGYIHRVCRLDGKIVSDTNTEQACGTPGEKRCFGDTEYELVCSSSLTNGDKSIETVVSPCEWVPTGKKCPPVTPFETPTITETPTRPYNPEPVIPTLTFPDLDICCNATWMNVTPNYTAPRYVVPGQRFWVNATVWNTCEACWVPNSTWLAAINEDARLFGPELIPLDHEVCGGQTYPFRFLLTAPINHPGDHLLRYQLLFENTTWCGEVLELEINVTGPWQQNQRVPEKAYMKSTVPGHFSLPPTKAADTAFAISEFAASKLPSTARFMDITAPAQRKAPNGEFGPVATLSAMVTSFRSQVGFIPTPSFNFKDLIKLRK